ASTPATIVCAGALRQRVPKWFSGAGDDDVDDWLDSYDRASRHNKWDPATKLNNAVFYLSDVANLWFKNHEATLATWEEFTTKIKEVFGRPAVRKLTAERKLNNRVQQPEETFTAYIEEVLQLCRRSNPDMTEKQKVNHILKGISEDAFQLLATQSDLAVNKIVQACQNYQEIRQQRLGGPRPTTTVPTLASLAPAPDDSLFSRESLLSFIREAVGDEVARALGTTTAARASYVPSLPTTPLGIRSLIQDEVVAALGPVPHPTPPPLVPTYAEVAARPALLSPHVPSPRAPLPPPVNTQPGYWRAQDGRPICFNCGIAGHIARYCRRRFPAYGALHVNSPRYERSYQDRYPSLEPGRRDNYEMSTQRPGRSDRPRMTSRSPSPRRRSPSPMIARSNNPTHGGNC
ncbi:unnamed protein product, partial [Ixodes hexagonus]